MSSNRFSLSYKKLNLMTGWPVFFTACRSEDA